MSGLNLRSASVTFPGGYKWNRIRSQRMTYEFATAGSILAPFNTEDISGSPAIVSCATVIVAMVVGSDTKKEFVASNVEDDTSTGPSQPTYPGGDWTDEKNARRCELIDRKIEGSLGSKEKVELEYLQEEMLRHRRKVAPLPLADLRELHQELLLKSLGNSK